MSNDRLQSQKHERSTFQHEKTRHHGRHRPRHRPHQGESLVRSLTFTPAGLASCHRAGSRQSAPPDFRARPLSLTGESCPSFFLARPATVAAALGGLSAGREAHLVLQEQGWPPTGRGPRRLTGRRARPRKRRQSPPQQGLFVAPPSGLEPGTLRLPDGHCASQIRAREHERGGAPSGGEPPPRPS